MKIEKIIGIVLVGLFLSQGSVANVDLDNGYPKVTENRAFSFDPSLEEADFSSTIDVSEGFPEVPNQRPLGACQSFAMAAWLEYIFYYKSGHIVDLSEKQLAYNLLEFMTHEFWDSERENYPEKYLDKDFIAVRPTLGSGIAPLMLESFFRTATIPDGVYSFGEMTAEEGLSNLDLDVYEKFFGEESETYSKQVYTEKLPEAFILQPPNSFIYKIKRTDFSTGEEETVKVRSAKEIGDYLGLSKENVTTYYNGDYLGYQQPLPSNVSIELMEYFDSISQHFDHVSEVASGQKIEAVIKDSLDKRMAVMIASNVWMGGWEDGTIFNRGGGHAMVIVGYQERDGVTYFKLRNSWGKDRLIRGYNYVKAKTLIDNTLYIVTHEM